MDKGIRIIEELRQTIKVAEDAGKLKQVCEELEWIKNFLDGREFQKENLIELNKRKERLLGKADILKAKLEGVQLGKKEIIEKIDNVFKDYSLMSEPTWKEIKYSSYRKIK